MNGHDRGGLNTLRLAIGWVVTVVWVASMALNFIDPERAPNPAIQVLMMVIVGTLFAPEVSRTIRHQEYRPNGKDHDESVKAPDP